MLRDVRCRKLLKGLKCCCTEANRGSRASVCPGATIAKPVYRAERQQDLSRKGVSISGACFLYSNLTGQPEPSQSPGPSSGQLPIVPREWVDFLRRELTLLRM